MSIAYIWIFLFLLAAGLPVVFALLIGPAASLALDGHPEFYKTLLARLYNGMDSFPLMAVPFFILAGELMSRGGVTHALVHFAKTLVGHVRGGLAQVNIVSSLMFAGMSGSAVADASALGSMLIPAMEKNDYPKPFAAAITAASSVIGPILPPSGLMILYAYVMNVSVAGLFLAGILPGVLVAVSLMVVTNRIAKKRGFAPAGPKASWPERGTAFMATFPALMTPVILLGGILGGVFTPTEAAAAAAIYALVVSVFVMRTLKLSELPGVFLSAATQSGVVLLLVGAAVTFAWIVTVSGLAEDGARALGATTSNVLLLLFLVNIFLLVVGMFLDAGPAILILGPVLAPLFVGLGVDPLHFAILMCVNVSIGLATPPMGLVLFVAASVSGEKTEAVTSAIIPFLLAEILVLLLLTYVPALSLTLPRLFGYA